MKVKFADSFFESLERLSRRDRWYNVLWRTVRYNIPNFLKNVWYFRAELYDFEPWDYRFNLNLFQKSLESTVDYLEKNGIEETVSLNKKTAKIRRAIELLENNKNDYYIHRAEQELGEIHTRDWFSEDAKDLTEAEFDHNKKVYDRSAKIEEQEWKELWQIIKGKKYKTYEEWDGSDLRSWWD